MRSIVYLVAGFLVWKLIHADALFVTILGWLALVLLVLVLIADAIYLANKAVWMHHLRIPADAPPRRDQERGE